MLAPRSTLTLSTPAPVPPETKRRLRLLLQARHGPCVPVLRPSGEPWATSTTYALSGPWRLSRADVHGHLVAIFNLLVAP